MNQVPEQGPSKVPRKAQKHQEDIARTQQIFQTAMIKSWMMTKKKIDAGL